MDRRRFLLMAVAGALGVAASPSRVYSFLKNNPLCAEARAVKAWLEARRKLFSFGTPYHEDDLIERLEGEVTKVPLQRPPYGELNNDRELIEEAKRMRPVNGPGQPKVDVYINGEKVEPGPSAVSLDESMLEPTPFSLQDIRDAVRTLERNNIPSANGDYYLISGKPQAVELPDGSVVLPSGERVDGKYVTRG